MTEFMTESVAGTGIMETGTMGTAIAFRRFRASDAGVVQRTMEGTTPGNRTRRTRRMRMVRCDGCGYLTAFSPCPACEARKFYNAKIHAPNCENEVL